MRKEGYKTARQEMRGVQEYGVESLLGRYPVGTLDAVSIMGKQ